MLLRRRRASGTRPSRPVAMSAIEAGSGTDVICALTEVGFGTVPPSVGALIAILPVTPAPLSVIRAYVTPLIADVKVVGVQISELPDGLNDRPPVTLPTNIEVPVPGFVWLMVSVKVTPPGIEALVSGAQPEHAVVNDPRSTIVGVR